MDAEQSDLIPSEQESKIEKTERSVCSSSEALVAKPSRRRKLRVHADMSGEDMQVSSTVASEGASDDPVEEGDDSNDGSTRDPGTPLQDEHDADVKSTLSLDEHDEAVGVCKSSGQDDHGELDYNEESGDGELPSDSEQQPQRSTSGKRVKQHKVMIVIIKIHSLKCEANAIKTPSIHHYNFGKIKDSQ